MEFIPENKDEGYMIYKIDNDKNVVRLWKPTQYSIISIASNKQEKLIKDDYIRITKDGEYVRIQESEIDEYPFVMRVIEDTVLNELDGFVYIIVKTPDEPIRDKVAEDRYIVEYLKSK